MERYLFQFFSYSLHKYMCTAKAIYRLCSLGKAVS